MAKKSNPTKNDSAKRKKKSKSGPKSIDMKLKAQASAPNPFEAIWSRRKFDILGKKRKGEERRIGLARSLAIEKRKKTLLKEYEQSTKSSVFVDKRIGEQNEALGEFDKAILRSQRERRLKLKKKSKYNLSDGEEEELDVGLSMGRDDFDEVPFDEDEDDRVHKSYGRSAISEQLDFHGPLVNQNVLMEGPEDRQKSKREVMEEIILKSKFFKAQKAKDKEENEQMLEQLDKDFTSMVQSRALVSLTQPNKINALKALVNKSIPIDNEKKNEAADSLRKDSLQKEKPDGYDKLLSEMALDIRARASELAKTPEEIAQEEKERLERLEEERKKRMAAADDSSDEDGNAYEDNDASRIKPISGDDLGDSFSHDEMPRSKLGWIDEILKRENEDESEDEGEDGSSAEDSENDEDDPEEEGTDEDDDKHGKSQTVKDWEQSDDEILHTDLEDSEDDFGEGSVNESKVVKKTKFLDAEENEKDKIDTGKPKLSLKQHSAQEVELPYTIEAPKSFEEFTSLLENCSDDQVIEAIRRIRAFNAIKVAAENRKKMQVFYGILLQYFAVMANKTPLNLKLLNSLVRPLMEMSTEIPYFAAICARQRLHRTRMLLCEDLKNEGKSCWPSAKTLFLLRLWSLIFPCSDFRHVVMTPAILLMSEYLMRCPITCGRDVAVGSFLCSMMLSVVKHSLKYCPEAIIFIQTLLLATSDKKQLHSKHSQLNNLLEIKGVKPLLHIQSRDTEIKALNFVTLMELPVESLYFSSDEFRVSILVAIMETLQGFVNIYVGFNSFPEIFMPIAKLLNELAAQNHMPDALKEKIKGVIQIIENKVEENHRTRQPLRMRKQKPVPIKMVNPQFEENFVKGRDYDPDRERAELRKLKKRVKQEAKGAVREIRKDNNFLFGVKERERAAQAEERAEKFGKALAFLQEQEHAFKSGQLGRNKKRRR